jgi:hypothetical protein
VQKIYKAIVYTPTEEVRCIAGFKTNRFLSSKLFEPKNTNPVLPIHIRNNFICKRYNI